jgi:hypothetical protein
VRRVGLGDNDDFSITSLSLAEESDNVFVRVRGP